MKFPTTSRPLDTSPEAWEVQLDIYRKMTPEERSQRGAEMADFSRGLLEDGVKYRHPEYSNEKVRLAVIRIILGEELFLKVYPQAQDILP